MKMIGAVVKPFTIDDVRAALTDIGVESPIVSDLFQVVWIRTGEVNAEAI